MITTLACGFLYFFHFRWCFGCNRKSMNGGMHERFQGVVNHFVTLNTGFTVESIRYDNELEMAFARTVITGMTDMFVAFVDEFHMHRRKLACDYFCDFIGNWRFGHVKSFRIRERHPEKVNADEGSLHASRLQPGRDSSSLLRMTIMCA
jgi:hypothetical protein